MAEEPGATREADTVGGSLPLHLALAHGAAEATCFALFDAFRDAVKTADAAGRLPLAVANEHHAPSAVTWALLMAHPDGARARSHAGVVAAGAGVPGAPRAHVERPMR